MTSRSPRRRVFALGASLASVGIVVACSSSGDRPPVADDVNNAIDAAPRPVVEAGSDGGKGAGGDAGEVPRSCSNTIRDGKETDVDCGGTECLKCIDGKRCVALTDCAGGACFENKCVTPACTDNVTNGGESDVDCGGNVCAKCTTGKKCNGASDCLSGTCVNQACACPFGMEVVTKASGGAYCVDRAEVSKGQYNKFITSNQSVTDQVDICKTANTTFIPRGAWPPATVPPNLAFNMGLPVHYVDWCDAFAYCKWSGKQLCGQINGGALDPASANDATKSAWYNACSAQGQIAFGYGNTFDAAKCNGGTVAYQDGGVIPANGTYGYGGTNQDEGVYKIVAADNAGNFGTYENVGCQAGSVGGLYQMSGNVAEWEDSCEGIDPSSKCKLRGGSYQADNSAPALACAAERRLARMPPSVADSSKDELKDVGFRCCLF
jgi:formylglycine-generating enzyme required for sulfatase activity